MCLKTYKRVLWSIYMVILFNPRKCNAITNSQFNASLRDYAVQGDIENNTEVKTLQKEYQKNPYFTPMTVPARYKEVSDSALAQSSSHSRGLLHHSNHGYGLANYDDAPHNGYGYEYITDEHDDHYDGHHSDNHHHPEHHHHLDHHHHPDHHHHVDHHYDHHSHHDDHKHGYGYHHKHLDHALAAKSVLWPIAGIALLGAAAALVSNPVLLQLGVVSGKRRRRNTEDYLPNISNKDIMGFHEKYSLPKHNDFKNYNKETLPITSKNNVDDMENTTLYTRAIKNHRLIRKVSPKVKKNIEKLSFDISKLYKEPIDKNYIPIPLKYKN